MPSDHTSKSVAKPAEAVRKGQQNPKPAYERDASEDVVDAKNETLPAA